MSPKFLVGTVGSDLLVRSDEACRDLVDEAKNYLLLPQERPLMQGPRTRPRKPTRRGEVLFAGKQVIILLVIFKDATKIVAELGEINLCFCITIMLILPALYIFT